jgi:hypothetical protein
MIGMIVFRDGGKSFATKFIPNLYCICQFVHVRPSRRFNGGTCMFTCVLPRMHRRNYMYLSPGRYQGRTDGTTCTCHLVVDRREKRLHVVQSAFQRFFESVSNEGTLCDALDECAEGCSCTMYQVSSYSCRSYDCLPQNNANKIMK